MRFFETVSKHLNNKPYQKYQIIKDSSFFFKMVKFHFPCDDSALIPYYKIMKGVDLTNLILAVELIEVYDEPDFKYTFIINTIPYYDSPDFYIRSNSYKKLLKMIYDYRHQLSIISLSKDIHKNINDFHQIFSKSNKSPYADIDY